MHRSLGISSKRLEVVGMHRAEPVSDDSTYELDLNILPVPMNSSPEEPTARKMAAEMVLQVCMRMYVCMYVCT
jgi:hypothetical protein